MLHMKQRPRIYYTETDKALMWDHWQKGDSLHAIARLFDRSHGAIARVLARTGGIRPPQRRRSRMALTLAEREEISRGVVLADGDKIISLTSNQSRSQKRIRTDQRKITFKPKKTADMIDRYLNAYRYIYENNQDQKHPTLGPFYSEYLLKPQPLATEIICALETYMAYDYGLAQSELELAFAFQLTDTKTDENGIKLKIAILSISGGTTNEAIDDRTHSITVKVKAAVAPDRSDADSIVRALYARWKGAKKDGLDQFSLYHFTSAFVSNVSKASARTAVHPYLWEAFQLAAPVYVANNKKAFDDERLPKCVVLPESWPFCL
jgi:hypothetical protein